VTETPAKQKKPDPCSFVIFGVTGDLAHRLVIPALYNLAATDLLPEQFCVVGIARTAMSDEELRDSLMKGLREFATRTVDDAIAMRLLQCVSCLVADPDKPDSFDEMRKELEKQEAARATGGNRLFYLATPPSAFAPITRQLGRVGLLKEEDNAWRRLIVEKPFGTDLASAKALNAELLKILEEHQIYRIDHYLGKETVQNILVLRFANGMFEPIWNRDHIDHVQITVDEKLGVGHRGSFYDATGALRDMVPNHLFQLLSLVAMEPPARFDAYAVRSEKAEVLAAIQTQTEAEALQNSVRGQYKGGKIGDDVIEDYRKTEDVKPDSTTETYAAIKLTIDNWRWAGVPVLSAHRQGARHQAHRGGDQVQAGAVFDVSRHRSGPAVAKLSRHQHRANRGHYAAVQHQGAGADDFDRRRRDEIPLQGLLQGRAGHRLRDADLRLHDRRQHPVSARRQR
jgi:glucose-6-phosphate 1-dehydrogenase